jgi:transcriptional regulator with XRE-family HTH domain
MTPARIQYELKVRNIKQRHIANECGVSQPTVHKVICNPDTVVSHRIAAVIAEKIGKPIDTVFSAYQPKIQVSQWKKHRKD